MKISTMSRFAALPAVAATAALIAPSAFAQVNDSFADGSPANSGAAGETAFFTTSSSSALDPDIPADAGILDFASGTSGRAIHTTFAPQTLTNVGDTLSVSYTFTTPATVGSGEDFRVGLFNTAGAEGFDANIDASSSAPNAILNIAGVSGEFDINASDADLALRVSDVNNVAETGGPTGRLLTTTGGFVNAGSGENTGFAIAANTSYTGTFVLSLDDAGVIVSQTLVGGAADESFTSDALAIADAVGTPGVGSTFDFLGFSVTSGAFGSVNNVGEPDNGLDFNNVSVTFTPAVVVPEPASMALLAAGATLLLGRRRA